MPCLELLDNATGPRPKHTPQISASKAVTAPPTFEKCISCAFLASRFTERGWTGSANVGRIGLRGCDRNTKWSRVTRPGARPGDARRVTRYDRISPCPRRVPPQSSRWWPSTCSSSTARIDMPCRLTSRRTGVVPPARMHFATKLFLAAQLSALPSALTA